MSSEQKVAIITGASQGIGAGLVKAFRDRNYRVVATSRSIKQAGDPDIVAVRGDIGDPATAERVVREAISRFGRDRHAGQQRRHLHRQALHRLHGGGLRHARSRPTSPASSTSRSGPRREMLKQGSGHIVSITTSLVDQPIAGVPAALANLTKGGINSATKALAIEYATRASA